MTDKAVYRTAPATPGLLIRPIELLKYWLMVWDSEIMYMVAFR